ncbi:sensor domain-containing diguanylate cyclase [Bacillus sp. CGMCC 1.16607]|uniref:sensor domain-containing diguanylate cyclase n=1 Tax=Bacillus sp. CGMCC 1.16607 TaxID=3351842 RepID=UPI00363F01C3
MNSKKITIQALIMALTAFAMIGTLLGSILSSVIVSKQNLESNYLNENQFYAQKLARTTDSLFKNMKQTLKVGANEVANLTKNKKALYSELNQIYGSTDFFNSIIFIDPKGIVISTAPHLDLEGKLLNSIAAKEALKKKAPLISQPYLGLTGRLIILVSNPVFGENGEYLGFIAGSIYLEEENSLQNTLGLHPEHLSNSYVYVVDSKGSIIYHRDENRIGDNVKENKAVKQVIKGKDGKLELINTKGIPMFAGYAYVKSSKWGIVSQTPKDSIKKPTTIIAKEVGKFTIPFMLFVFLVTFILLKRIVNPLRILADFAHNIINKPSIPLPTIPESFFELKELKKSMFIMIEYYKKQIHVFEKEAILDPLTELYNRRAFNKQISEYNDYSLALFDIDYFKSVNDEYGHLMGDKVLIFLADLIRRETRDEDLCFRFGGEEFLILFPNTDLDEAYTITDHIRSQLETATSPIGRSITISAGVGNMPKTAIHHTELFDLIDQALYQAKNDGRNRVVRADGLKKY